jgi:hypothetical protein
MTNSAKIPSVTARKTEGGGIPDIEKLAHNGLAGPRPAAYADECLKGGQPFAGTTSAHVVDRKKHRILAA